KTKNSKDYQFGNQFNYQATVYKQFGDSLQIIPSVGAIYENYASNKQFDEVLANTEGTIWMSRVGIDVKNNQWSFGVQWFAPLDQRLLNGNVKAQNRCSVHLNYTF